MLIAAIIVGSIVAYIAVAAIVFGVMTERMDVRDEFGVTCGSMFWPVTVFVVLPFAVVMFSVAALGRWLFRERPAKASTAGIPKARVVK